MAAKGKKLGKRILDSKYCYWSQDDVDYVCTNYGNLSASEISKKLNKSLGSVYYILKKENIDVEKNYWDKIEIEILKEKYGKHSNQELENILNRSTEAIQQKAASLGLRKDEWWSEEDLEELRHMAYEGKTYKFIAEALDRSFSSIHNKYQELGLSEDCRRWTEQEKQKIIHLASSGKYTYQDLAIEMQATPAQIMQACKYYECKDNIKRSVSYGNDLMLKILKDEFSHFTIKSEYSIGEKLRLDAYILELRIGFEFDGIQHFRYTPIWHKSQEDFEKAKQRDIRKDEICKELGITLIRIKYDEKLSHDLIREKVSKFLSIEEESGVVAPKKEKIKIPKPTKYNWPKGQKIQGRKFNGEPIR